MKKQKIHTPIYLTPIKGDTQMEKYYLKTHTTVNSLTALEKWDLYSSNEN